MSEQRNITLVTVLLLLYFPSTVATVTISTNKLFQNTIKRWAIDLKNAKDRSERWNRLVEAKRSVERTTSGVMLNSLNRFTVANNEEFENIVRPLFSGFNVTDTHADSLVLESKVTNRKRSKRSLPATYDYWEKEVGLSASRDQMSCGSCWSFPDVVTMEALNKHLSGDETEFSEQYFVDCTFSYSGCAGGTVNEGYKLTMMRQYLVSAEDWPYTADYMACKFTDDIANFRNNALTKIWIQDSIPLSKSEGGMLEGLQTSPVAFGTHISLDLYSYSGGEYRDSQCATESMPHAMLLVGYTERILRVKASYGTEFGDGGYIDYIRGDGGLQSCEFYNNAFMVLATYRRDLEYEYCNDGQLATYQDCRDSCQAMNTKQKTGWDLAVIPTEYHNQLIVDKLEADYPGQHITDKFKLVWIGLLDEDKTETYKWVDEFTPVNYFNMSRNGGGNKYGLIDKNSGEWLTKNSLTFEARGLCSRAVNCWNIQNAIKNGKVTFSKADLTEGTKATVKCKQGQLVGANKLSCVGGQWDQPLPTCGDSIGGLCTYHKEAGPEATISPNKEDFSKKEKITITCTDVSTEHICTDGAFKPEISPCASYDTACTVVKSDLLILEPPEQDFIPDGEKLKVMCVENKELSQTLTCSQGVFQPALIPSKLCPLSKAGQPTLSVILVVLLGLSMVGI